MAADAGRFLNEAQCRYWTPGVRGALKEKKKKRKVFLYTVFPKRSRAAHSFNHGWWRFGDWRLAVGNWRLVAVGGGWRRLVVGDWWRLAVVGSRNRKQAVKAVLNK